MRHVARATFGVPVRGEDAWKWQGLCRKEGRPEWWFPEGRDRAVMEQLAIKVCLRCPIRERCREEALSVKEPYGVWGAMRESELRKLVGKAGQ